MGFLQDRGQEAPHHGREHDVFQREANLTLKLSDLYTKRFRLIQSYGPLGYNAMLGDYTLTYIAAYQGEKKTADVKLIADQAKMGFILQGLAADIPVAFEEKTNTLTIKPQELTKPPGCDGIAHPRFVCWLVPRC